MVREGDLTSVKPCPNCPELREGHGGPCKHPVGQDLAGKLSRAFAYDEWRVQVMNTILCDATFVGASAVSCKQLRERDVTIFVVKAEGLSERKCEVLATMLSHLRRWRMVWMVIS